MTRRIRSKTASANYTISLSALGSGQVVFNTQPGEFHRGTGDCGSPISVTVFDASHAGCAGRGSGDEPESFALPTLHWAEQPQR